MSLSLSGDIQPAEPVVAAPPPVAELRQTLLRSHTSPSPLFSFDLHPHPLLRFRNRPPPPLTGGGAAVRRDERERPRERDREERERTDDGGGDRWFLSRTSSRRLGPADGVKVRRAMSLSDELFRFHGSDGSRLHPTNFDECAFFLFLFRVNTVMLHSG
ncbi:hypothetical protein HanIR_Chr13g0623621 [Helianthus annuus]|nr:hypothetical protein HanIR_Chr13g0623621 [Helianthus annuus]